MDIAVNTIAAGGGTQGRAEDSDWDWEAARVDGKLIRFGYQRDCVLVLVFRLPGPNAPDCRPWP